MKLICTAIGSGFFFGAVFYFTISQANAGFCIGNWEVGVTLESIKVDDEPVAEYQIESVSWPHEADIAVAAGNVTYGDFKGHNHAEENICFEFESEL